MNAWLFDIDGVLTDPNTKQVPSEDVLFELNQRLNRGDVIGFNTGRSLSFVIDRLLQPLEKLTTDKKLLKNVITIAEKGGLVATYNDLGQRTDYIDPTIQVPDQLVKSVKTLVNQDNYTTVMFLDQTKKTMVSIEMIDNPNQDRHLYDTFKQRQLILNHDIEQLLIDMKLTDQIKIDTTRIAIDVESCLAGKTYGTKKFLQILHDFHLHPEKYFSFGDSPSDREMHQQLILHHPTSSFIFVGDPSELSKDKIPNCIFTQGKLTTGTLEYLKQ